MTNTITVSLAEKTMTASNVMTIREKVSVIVTGATGATAAGLFMRLLEPSGFAEMAVCTAFTASGDDFTGTLDLSGTALAAEFEGDDAKKKRVFIMQFYNKTTDEDSEIITDKVFIMNNPLTATIEAETPTEI